MGSICALSDSLGRGRTLGSCGLDGEGRRGPRGSVVIQRFCPQHRHPHQVHELGPPTLHLSDFQGKGPCAEAGLGAVGRGLGEECDEAWGRTGSVLGGAGESSPFSFVGSERASFSPWFGFHTKCKTPS